VFIFRYPLDVSDESGEPRPVSEIEIQMPVGARVLDVALAAKGLVLYALVNDEAEEETRSFVVATTGSALPDADWDIAAFLGTVKIPGSLGWHVFEAARVTA
jgi:hypothetical protein